MGKKKATGMSKRLGFTDRATIAENKEILRYNERLEREATGEPADPRPARRGRDERSNGDKRERGQQQASVSRPPRAPRPPRPPALSDEQTLSLQAALAAAVGETGLELAGAAVIAQLGAHASFDKASAAGWEIAAGGHASERTEAEWELLRKTWLGVRIALLEAYTTVKPELEPTLSRERKQLARLQRPARSAPRRQRAPRGRARKAGGEAAPGDLDGAGSAVSVGTARDASELPGARAATRPPGGPPSPADVARRVAHGAPAALEPVEPVELSPSPVDPDEAADRPVDPQEGRVIAAELRAEHGGAVSAELPPDTGEENQLSLEL